MLYISDLDGTLLNTKAELSDYSREKLAELIRGGVKFTVASARSVVAVQKLLKDVPLRLPVIELGGAFLSDLATGKHLVINEMKEDAVLGIYNYLQTRDFYPFISTFNGEEDCLYYSKLVNGGQEWYYNNRTTQKDRRLRHIPDLATAFDDQVVCITVIDTREVLDELYVEFLRSCGPHIRMYLSRNIYSPQWCWLTIHSNMAAKDQAILTLKNKFGCSKDRVTVFGDNINDIPIFQCADKSIAVANAAEELKKYADEVIGSNNENSVVDYILADGIHRRERKAHPVRNI